MKKKNCKRTDRGGRKRYCNNLFHSNIVSTIVKNIYRTYVDNFSYESVGALHVRPRKLRPENFDLIEYR